MMSKKRARHYFRELREAILPERRLAAAQALATQITQKTEPAGAVLSFASFGTEIDTTPLNTLLVKTEKLVLPALCKTALHLYRIGSLNDLQPGAFGILEPNIDRSIPISLEEIDWILVPALAFDDKGHRVGYGGGYYDRLLLNTKSARTIGIGFREQLSNEPLQIDTWDCAVDELLLI